MVKIKRELTTEIKTDSLYNSCLLFELDTCTQKPKESIKILSKYEAKNILMDNQRKLNLNQDEYCVLNYLIKISEKQDWIIKNPIVEIHTALASEVIGLEISCLLSSLYLLEKKGLVVKKNRQKHILSLLPLIGLLLPFSSSNTSEFEGCYS